MKKTLSTNEAAHLLTQDQFARWSYEGAYALVEHLEQLDEDMDTESEFDPIAIRCDYSEYESPAQFISDYTSKTVEDDDEALELLENETVVIQFKGGIIIQNF